MRRLLAPVLIVALVAVSAASAAERHPHAEKERLTAADNALARSVAVRASDLPVGWRRVALPPDDGSRCKSFDPDLSAFTITGKARAGWVDAAGTGRSVVSLVEVYASRAQAAGDFAAAARPAAVGCLREGLTAGVAGRVPFRVVTARMVPAPRVGDRSAAYRVVVALTPSTLPVRVYLDVVVVQRGRSIAALMLTGIHESLPGRDALARTVAARMR